MGSSWLKNFLGFKLTDEQMKDIPYPAAEVYAHVVLKDIQTFGILGTLIVGPATAMLRSQTRNIIAVKTRSVRYGSFGVVIGCFLGPLMTYGRMKQFNFSHEAFYDRSYRLRYNRDQVRVDRGSLVGAVGGATVSSMIGQGVAVGGLLGMSVGVVAMAFYNQKVKDKKSKSMEAYKQQDKEKKTD